MLIPWGLYKKNFNFPLFSLLCISIVTQFTAQESTWIGFHYLSQAFQVRLQFSSGLSKNCFVPTLTETQNHRRANAGRGFLWWSCPKPPVKVGSITADCSGSCPISGFNISAFDYLCSVCLHGISHASVYAHCLLSCHWAPLSTIQLSSLIPQACVIPISTQSTPGWNKYIENKEQK